MWVNFPIIGSVILLLFLTKTSTAVKGCTVILRHQRSTMKKAVCNTPNVILNSIPLDLPSSLVELDISFQNLKIVYNKQFIHLPNLETLSITSSNVHTIQEGAFILLSKLQKLILTNNSLIIASQNPMALTRSVFLPLLDLRSVDLSFNFISDIPDYFFSHVNLTLEILQLSHSKTELILTRNSLMFLGVLKTLNLDFSQITTLTNDLEDAFNAMVDLKEIILLGNLWNCDCQLKWFIIWMMKKFQLKTEITNPKRTNLICSTPQSMKNFDLLGKQYSLIEGTEFRCSPEPITSNSTVSSYAGQNISLSCIFKNVNNDQTILWTNNDETLINSLNDKRFIITETKGKYRKSILKIVNISKVEEGVWKCLVKSNQKTIEIDFMINVENDYFPDNSQSTLKTSILATKSGTDYILVSLCSVFVFLVVLLLGIYYFRYCKGRTLSIKNRSHFNLFTKNRSKETFFKITNKNDGHNPMNPFAVPKDSVKLEEKVYDDVPISSGFYINFSKKKNEQNFSTLNCMDCQNYAIVDESTNNNTNIHISSKSKSPRFWYLDDSMDGIDNLPNAFAIRKNITLNDISERDSAFITRIPGKTPCPLHSSQSSVDDFKNSLSDFSKNRFNVMDQIDSCPVHGKKHLQNTYSVHFSIPDQQLNNTSKHSLQPPNSPNPVVDSISSPFKKSQPQNYFPVYLSTVDDNGTQTRPYSCLTNSVV